MSGMNLSASLAPLLPELFLSVAAMVLLLVGVFVGRARAREIGFAAAACLVAAILLTMFGGDEITRYPFGGAFVDDALARIAKAFIYAAALVGLLMSDRYLTRERLSRPEFPILILLSCVGMGLMVSANDLISLYMGVELQSLSLYILAAFNRDSTRSTEAGLKYFVLGALSSGLLLYGGSLIYGFTGSTNFQAIALVGAETLGTAEQVGLVFGLVFLISGLAFKISAAPFHMWTPDVYEGSPTPVTAFFAAAPKLAGMVLFGRVLVEGFPLLLGQWQPIVWLIAAASMIVGALSALVQTNIKRLMAYSSIGHVGYALMGVAAGTEGGLSSMVTYMVIYLVMTLGTFACILGMRRPEGMAENISDLAGLSQSQRGLAWAFTFLFVSLAGIPIFIGFFAKFFVFMAAVEAELWLLLVFGVVTSVIATYYYLSVIKAIWFDEPQERFVVETGPAVTITAYGAAAVTVLGLVFMIGPLTRLAAAAAAPLF